MRLWIPIASQDLFLSSVMSLSGLGLLCAIPSWKHLFDCFGSREHFSWVSPLSFKFFELPGHLVNTIEPTRNMLNFLSYGYICKFKLRKNIKEDVCKPNRHIKGDAVGLTLVVLSMM